ncbi:MAG: TetR/AcrR family transcriptional regulator [Candidatus Zixiibacteriota bacterium]
MTPFQRMTAVKRKSQIVEQATKLFAKFGYEKVTIGLLAKKCNVSEPALYRYFSSKESIYDAVLDKIRAKSDMDSLREKIFEKEDIEEILLATAKSLLDIYLNNPEVTRLFLFCSLEAHSKTKDIFQAIRIPYTELLKKIFTRLKSRKLIHPVNPEITARCFVGMVSECAIGSKLWKKYQGKAFDPYESMKNSVPIFARGLKLTT